MIAACGGGSTPPPAAPPPPPTAGFDQANFDKAVRPQDDFYKYVNGTWLAKTELPAEKASFFIGSAQEWREKDRDEFLRVVVTSNERAPSMYRGRVPMTNVDAFYEAFDVKAGDKMFRKPDDRVADLVAAVEGPSAFRKPTVLLRFGKPPLEIVP